MDCKKIKEMLPAYVAGELSKEEVILVEKGLKDCEECSKELEEIEKLEKLLPGLANEEPLPESRSRFLANLEVEKEKLSQKRGLVISLSPMWTRVAAAVTFLVIGFSLGKISNPSTSNDEMATLRTEMSQMKEMVLLSMLKNETASERIEAVSFVGQMDSPSIDVAMTLIHTLNTDESPNVRLSAVRALEIFASNESVRLQLIKSLESQTDPVVQIALINLMVELEEKRAAKKFQEIIDQEETEIIVKDQARIGLQLLI